VRAIEMLHDRFQSGMTFLHAKRWGELDPSALVPPGMPPGRDDPS
jgi:hypothetical protein